MALIKRSTKGTSLTFDEMDGNLTHLGGDGSYQFPATDGTSNQTLTTDGNGQLSFTDAGGLSNVVDDTTPQLGGNLDVNGNSIVSTSDGDIAITPNGTGKVILGGDLTITAAIDETVFNLTGTALDASNGTIQTKTLTENTTLTDSLNEGEAITLMIDDGSAHTLTFPTITFVNNGGVAPTLATTGYTVFAIWKVSTVLYGALVGDGS
jgi:hypothetical protein